MIWRLEALDVFVVVGRNILGLYDSSRPVRHLRSRDSSVGIATRYVVDGPGIESRWGARFAAPVQTDPGAHPASCTMGTGSLPGVKQAGRGDHAPASSARLKKEYSYTSAPPVGLRGLL